MPILSEDHVPLYYTIDIDDTHDIIDPHSDCIEAQSAPQAITRKSVLSYCFSWMKRSMNVSEADPNASSSQTDHASWPIDLHDHYKHLSHKPAQDLVDSNQKLDCRARLDQCMAGYSAFRCTQCIGRLQKVHRQVNSERFAAKAREELADLVSICHLLVFLQNEMYVSPSWIAH